jgi:2-C-methyl-D-erythritol 4-phosphate cytidylyltransferase/2-C-methyl-D-erythritol 2,4-cyclodiphosphate synthase
VIAEVPKIGPHRAAIRERIAEIAGVRVDQVSIKATTTEGLGFTGRREGIAAQAVASIRMGYF